MPALPFGPLRCWPARSCAGPPWLWRAAPPVPLRPRAGWRGQHVPRLSYDGEPHEAALKAAGGTNKFVIEEARMALFTAFYLQPVVEAQKALT